MARARAQQQWSARFPHALRISPSSRKNKGHIQPGAASPPSYKMIYRQPGAGRSGLKSHYNSVHCNNMKNITLSAEETLIEQARLVARAQHKTLNAAFSEWLEQYAAQAGGGAAVDALMRRLRHVRSSGPYTREEMNER